MSECPKNYTWACQLCSVPCKDYHISKPASVPSADDLASQICFSWADPIALIEADRAAQRQAGREEMREILTEAMEAMDERRCYLDIWEWKYGERWNREDSAIRKALSDLEGE